MMKLSHINKSYQQNQILHDIQLEFQPQHIYLIKGVSGCGKTTLMNIIAGFDQDYEGQIETDFIPNIGYIFQNSFLIKGLSVIENLDFVTGHRESSRALLALFHMEDLQDKPVTALSGGQRQRLSVLRGIANQPNLLLCDEPTASLDEENAHLVAQSIAALRSPERIIIISTHDDCFDKDADVIIHLDYGHAIIQKQQQPHDHEPLSLPTTINRDYKNIDRIYIQRKKQKRYSHLTNQLSLTVMLLLLLLVLGFQFNYQDNLVNSMKANYPLDTFTISSQHREQYENQGVTIYDDYLLLWEDVRCYSYYPDHVTPFKIPNIIQEGYFPTQDNEIIINDVLAERLKIGDTITIHGQTFKVSAIVSENDEVISLAYNTVPYYDLDAAHEKIYLANNKLEQLGEPIAADTLFCYYQNLFDSSLMQTLNEEEMGTTWSRYCHNLVSQSQNYLYIFMGVTIFSGLLVFAFLYQDMALALDQQKRKIGYLSILNLSEKRIRKLYIGEYLYEFKTAIALTLGAYVLAGIILKYQFHYQIFGHLYYLPLVLAVIFLFEMALIQFPLNHLLKQNRMTLLQSS